jgi:hypothetical protein
LRHLVVAYSDIFVIKRHYVLSCKMCLYSIVSVLLLVDR